MRHYLTAMRLKELDLFVFDLAGTTVRDDGFVQRAFEGAAQDAGLRTEREWLRARMGWSKTEVFTDLLERNGQDHNRAPALVRAFEAHLIAIYTECPIALTHGAGQAIAALDTAGVTVAFSTGFPRVIMDRILTAMGWSDRPSVASDEVAQGRPAPDLIRAAMRLTGVAKAERVGAAGDTPSDLEAASRAGCAVIAGLGCGTHTLEELSRYEHTHLATDPLHLVSQLTG